ncbi:exodeoxyribonuclease VII small subunit [Levilactobacillus bambusae]|uniref:Exodeoxyribonuclease 7 small subunit n=1 Tax=Levilactobacillus bambusae TaxID=2024736 RepID=A0A2V1N0Y8_9LACO|nr:exodeoxyribonuclease VII small subunit [Levilactobacillus bambusae]PWG00929.1 exodeoxyribonuclease VII small subunit [Levilactobacillus bambusae]
MSEAKQPTFEENLTSLEEIVTHLEQGNVPLEEALDQFQTGVKLSKQLQETLDSAEKTLATIMDDQGKEEAFEVSNEGDVDDAE